MNKEIDWDLFIDSQDTGVGEGVSNEEEWV